MDESRSVSIICMKRLLAVLIRLIRAIPFTLGMLLLVVGSGIVIGASDPGVSADYAARYGYSLERMRRGQFWVILTMIPPWADWRAHVPVIINFLVVLGACEWWIGRRHTWLVYLAGHVITMLLVTVALLVSLRLCGSGACGLPAWQIDTGTSAGVVCCLGAASTRFAWRRWLLPAAMILLIGWLLSVRMLYAVEHLIAYPVGYALGRRLIGAHDS
jgi:hypothetical protein